MVVTIIIIIIIINWIYLAPKCCQQQLGALITDGKMQNSKIQYVWENTITVKSMNTKAQL